VEWEVIEVRGAEGDFVSEMRDAARELAGRAGMIFFTDDIRGSSSIAFVLRVGQPSLSPEILREELIRAVETVARNLGVIAYVDLRGGPWMPGIVATEIRQAVYICNCDLAA
jgi:mannose/fructose-specific phosphotransferase system component IIA